MTANISQHVTPRNQSASNFTYLQTRTGGWQGRRRNATASFRQAGSITQSTLTISFGLLAVIAISMLTFVYLQQVFGTASKGADIQELKTQVVELREQQKQLELEGAKLRSIQTVEERVEDLNLVQSDKVSYLAPTNSEHVALATE